MLVWKLTVLGVNKNVFKKLGTMKKVNKSIILIWYGDITWKTKQLPANVTLMPIIFMVEHLYDQVYKNREFTKSIFVFCNFKVKLVQ